MPETEGADQASPEALKLAARMHRVTNAFHGFVYFAPECHQEFSALGLNEDQEYFASRAAPMGPVPAETVMATFFNFAPRRVREAIPSAWDVASPQDIQQARFRAVAQRLELAQGVVEAADIERDTLFCQEIVSELEWSARPLGGANAAVPLPDEPLLRLWQLVAVLREWRGDAHIAALAAAGVGSIECLITHAATGEVPKSSLMQSRGWTDQEWDAGVGRLMQRGWCEADGSHTPAGVAARAEIEATTNVLSSAMWNGRHDEALQLHATLKALAAPIWQNMPMPDWTKS